MKIRLLLPHRRSKSKDLRFALFLSFHTKLSKLSRNPKNVKFGVNYNLNLTNRLIPKKMGSDKYSKDPAHETLVRMSA